VRSEFSMVYKRLNIDNLVDRGESFYQEMMTDVVQELAQKGPVMCVLSVYLFVSDALLCTCIPY